MARPRPQIQRDPPDMIAARQRKLDQTEMHVVLAKTSGGTIVKMIDGDYVWHDGIARPYAPWQYPVPEDVAKKLEAGVAEKYVFRFLAEHGHNVSMGQALNQWQPVQAKKNMVYVPFVTSSTDGFVHIADSMLHFRDRGLHQERQRERNNIVDIDRITSENEQAAQEALSVASGGKVSNVGMEITNDGDAVQFSEVAN